MKVPCSPTTVMLLAQLCIPLLCSGAPKVHSAETFVDYFRAETAAIERAHSVSNITTLEHWTGERETLRAELREMLGLDPWPPRTDLHAVITGTIRQEQFTVEKLHFQALPQLYVTANLYLPLDLSQRVPAVLYACGHARMVTNDISCGNKSWYQHHGEWFARNGFACLVIDTVQLGEIQGLHHGTYRENQWWWNSRGYTPAGVEAWFGIRALDYLCSRPEIDRDRIGMTGRSGGGSYTWTVAALDDRVKVAAPVAGITDLRDQVVDGAIEGHCDCMFFLNTYRWDFPQLASLVAPRPLLIANSDKDTIFPLDGVERLHNQVRHIYELYKAEKNLGLLITEGPHSDTQDLQLPVFRWFNRFLKSSDPLIDTAARKFVESVKLRVFDKLPADEVNSRIQESFVPPLHGLEGPGQLQLESTLSALRNKVFCGWPHEPWNTNTELKLQTETKWNGAWLRSYTLQPQRGVELELHVLTSSRSSKPDEIALTVLDAADWTNSSFKSLRQPGRGKNGVPELAELAGRGRGLALFAPRYVEPEAWFTNKAKYTNFRRRYMLVGQTLDSMRVWDIRCAIHALNAIPELRKSKVMLRANREMAINVSYAALFEPGIASLELREVPRSHLEGPDYLNVLRVWDIPDLLTALRTRAELKILPSQDSSLTSRSQ